MSNTRVTLGSAAALLLCTLVPVGQASAAPSEDIQACLAPIAVPPRSPDVMQGWIDGCRAAEVARTAALLGNHV